MMKNLPAQFYVLLLILNTNVVYSSESNSIVEIRQQLEKLKSENETLKQKIERAERDQHDFVGYFQVTILVLKMLVT
jgi:hypothetical protein